MIRDYVDLAWCYLRFCNTRSTVSAMRPFRELNTMLRTLVNIFQNEDGATAIEYGLIAALIAVAAVATMSTVGTNLKAVFGSVASSL